MLQDLLVKGMKNTELLIALQARAPDCVLITGDESLPIDHWNAIRQSSIAIAIIDREIQPGYSPDQWDADTVHRWLHKIEVQAIGEVRRYWPKDQSTWKPRKRPRTKLVEQLQRQVRP